MVIHAPQRTRTGKSLFGRETKGSRWGGSCDVEWVPGHLFSLFWEGDLPQALLVPFLTLFQQHKRRLYTWTSPDSQYWNQIDYILCSQRWRSSIQSAKTRPGADYGSDNELLIGKFRLKLKKEEKITRPFRYDLNQIPYNYTVEVRNRFKGLDLIECLKNYGRRFMTLYRRQGKTISRKKKCKKAKWLFGKALQIAEKRSERQRRKRKIYPSECSIPNNSKER